MLLLTSSAFLVSLSPSALSIRGYEHVKTSYCDRGRRYTRSSQRWRKRNFGSSKVSIKACGGTLRTCTQPITQVRNGKKGKKNSRRKVLDRKNGTRDA